LATIVLTPLYWQQASSELALADPVLSGLVERFAGMALVSRADPFLTLLRSIVGQQISVKAADTVWARLQLVVPEITPASILGCPIDGLRGCGLSARKVEYAVGGEKTHCQYHARIMTAKAKYEAAKSVLEKKMAKA